MQLISFTKHLLNQDFCLYYKVKKIIKIELSPGQSHKHKATYHINKRVTCSVKNLRHSKRCNKIPNVRSIWYANQRCDRYHISDTSTIAMDVVNRLSYKYIRDVVIRDSYVSTTALGQITTANIISDSSIKPDAET